MRTFVLSAIVLAMLVAPAAAGDAPDTTYRGRVIDSNGHPLAGAKINAYAWVADPLDHLVLREIAAMATAADGTFAFTPRGEIPLTMFATARKEGFSCGWFQWEDGEPLRNDVDANIELGNPASLSGTVVDEAGGPITGAAVRLVLEMNTGGRSRRTFGGSPSDWLIAKTGADGRFEFAGLPASAQAAFLVDAPGKAGISGFRDLDSPEPKYAPSQKDIKLVLKPEGRIEGMLVDKDGKPLAGAAVLACEEAFFADMGDRKPVTTDANGKFAVGGLDAGEHSVRLVSPNARPELIAVKRGIAVENGKTTSGVMLQAGSGALLQVTVTDANGTPLSGARVYAQQQPDPDSLGDSEHAKTDDKGVAVFRLEPGYYEASASTIGFQLACVRGKLVEEGKTRQVKMQLNPEVKIRGVAVDEAGKAVAGAVVRMSYSLGSSEALTTDANGAVAFVMFVSAYEPVPDTSGTLLARHAGRGLVGEKEFSGPDRPVRITLKPGLTLKGQVVGEDGKPVAKANVSVGIKPMLIVDVAKATTDEHGLYQVKAVPAGDCLVTAQAEGFGISKVSVKAGDGNGPLAVETITLKPAKFAISGVVKDEDGKAVAGASVCPEGEGQSRRKEAKTDKEGKFTIDKLVEGEVLLHGYSGALSGRTKAQTGDKDVEIIFQKPPAPASAPAAVEPGTDF